MGLLRRRTMLPSIAFVVVMSGCGLSIIGTADENADGGSGGTGNGTVPPGANVDGQTGSPIGDASGAVDTALTPTTPAPPCIELLGVEWSAVAFASNRATACPATLTSLDLLANPATTAGACACACQISGADPPSCAKGNVQISINAPACTSNSALLTLNEDTCTPMNGSYTIVQNSKLPPPPIHKGTCTSSAVKDEAKLITSPARTCSLPAGMGTGPEAEAICNGTAPSGFTACVMRDGDVPCPGAPFVQRSVVVNAATLTCGGCTTCTGDVACGQAMMHYYSNAGCGTETGTRVANGQCNTLTTGSVGAPFNHYRWRVTATNQKCIATPAVTTNLALAGTRTICCR